MDIRAIKHVAKLSEWSERIRACRSIGKQVKTWCEENGINIKSYYRWEQLCIAEAFPMLQIGIGASVNHEALGEFCLGEYFFAAYLSKALGHVMSQFAFTSVFHGRFFPSFVMRGCSGSRSFHRNKS